MISLVTIAIIAVAIWLVVKYVKGKKKMQTPAPNSKQSKKNFMILAGIAVGFIILCCVLKKKSASAIAEASSMNMGMNMGSSGMM